MKKHLFVYIFSCLLALQVSAQYDNTMYFMDRLPQSSRINPAQTPDCKFYMGGLLTPLFGQLPPSLMLAVNIPIDYNDVIFHGTGEYSDSLITPLHPNANIDDFLKKLRKVNYLSTDLQLDLLNIGFRAGEKNFFTFDVSEKFFFNFGLPGDLFALAAKGNDAVRNADFTGLGVNTTYYHQIALGYKRQFTKSFAAGLRAKMLIGVANVSMGSSKITLKTSDRTNDIHLYTEYEVNTNLPLEVTLDENGYVSDIAFQEFSKDSIADIIKNYGFMTGSYGFATDFGFSWDVTKALTCYFSAEDIGFINWMKDGSQFAIYDEDSLSFEGMKIHDLEVQNFSFDMDSIVDNFKEIQYKEQQFKTWMPAKLYFGARYKVANRISLGALARADIFPHKIRPGLTLSANFKPFKFTAATISYSIVNNKYNNLGLGFTVHPGPVQWYFVSDNILGAALFPADTRSVSIRMGCNFVLGVAKKDNKRKDRSAPLMKRSNSRGYKGSVLPYSR